MGCLETSGDDWEASRALQSISGATLTVGFLAVFSHTIRLISFCRSVIGLFLAGTEQLATSPQSMTISSEVSFGMRSRRTLMPPVSEELTTWELLSIPISLAILAGKT